MQRLRLLFFSTLLFVGLAAQESAATPPKPEKKSQSLELIQKRLAEEKEQQSQLDRELRKTKDSFEQTQKRLIKITDEARKNEERLNMLETRIKRLRRDERKIKERLEADYGTIGNVILALERMRRIPPEAIIVRPGTPLETAQTAMLLQSTLPAVNKRAQQLSSDLKQLHNIEKQLEEDKKESLYNQKQLDQKRMVIAGLMVSRRELFEKTKKDYELTSQRVTHLSKEAENLQDLVEKLQKDSREQRTAGLKSGQSNKQGKVIQASIPAPGVPRLPVTGRLLTGFGEQDQIGAKSEGITIETRPGSVVAAPMSGVVRFANSFKNYGNLLIIEHKNGYHSLVAGFARIDTVVGQTIKAGEPIGILPITSSRGGRPALYYELRQQGKAVSPARLFDELKS